MNRVAFIVHVIGIIAITILFTGCERKPANEVVVYTSLDQTFSQPIAEIFERDTGIAVKVVYDTEATKTTGLVNRLIAEKNNPQADVFWNSETARTIQLNRAGVLAPYESPSAKDIPDQFKDSEHYWTGFAARARVLIVNTELVPESEYPTSIFELVDPKWKGQVGLAYPLFGTTATHGAALFSHLGDNVAKQYFQALKANDVVIVDGNSTAKDRVASGQLKIAITDTDDVNVAIAAGKPVTMIFPDKAGLGTLLIPNTVALVAGGPNPGNGKKLIDFLLSRETESKLALSKAIQLPLREGVLKSDKVPDISEITTMTVDFEKVADQMQPSGEFFQKLFVR